LNDVADALGDLLLDEPTVRDACEHFVEIVAKGRWEKKRDVLPDDFTLNRSYMRSAPGLHLVITPSIELCGFRKIADCHCRCPHSPLAKLVNSYWAVFSDNLQAEVEVDPNSSTLPAIVPLGAERSLSVV
jgi:hypothetical protein